MHFSMPSELVYIAAVVAIPLNRLGHEDNVGNHKLITQFTQFAVTSVPTEKEKKQKQY